MLKRKCALILVLASFLSATKADFIADLKLQTDGYYRGYFLTEEDGLGDPNPLMFICFPDSPKTLLIMLPQVEHRMQDGPVNSTVQYGSGEKTSPPWSVEGAGQRIVYSGDPMVFVKKIMLSKRAVVAISDEIGKTASGYLLDENDLLTIFSMLKACNLQ